jgi:hypothetical protein
MAKVKAPLMSEAAVGTLGGITYRNNGYGPYVSRRPVAPHLMTPTQTLRRSQLKLAHSAYMSLSDNQKAEWESVRVPPETGRNLYIACAMRALATGLPAPTSIDRSVPEHHLSDFELVAAQKSPPFFQIDWIYSGTFGAIVIPYYLLCWSNRETPKPRKLLMGSSSPISFPGVFVDAKYWAPVLHCRLDIVSEVDFRIYSQTLLRFIPFWT